MKHGMATVLFVLLAIGFCGITGAQGSCVPDFYLLCNEADQYYNDGVGSTQAVDSYSCGIGNETGPEYTYEFISNYSAEVTVTLSGLSEDLDLFVLTNNGDCDPNACLEMSINGGQSDETITFSSVAGQGNFIVVDGYDGSVSQFDIHVSCIACAVPYEDLEADLYSPFDGAVDVGLRPMFSWQCTQGALDYKVRVNTVLNDPDYWTACESDVPHCIPDEPLDPGTTYWFHVYAYDNPDGVGQDIMDTPYWQFTTTAEGVIFADGFESGDTSAWAWW